MTGGFDHDREGLPGATLPYQQVFAYWFGEDPAQPFRVSNPGFNSSPVLPQSYRLTISIDGGLQYWSGAGQPSFAPVAGGLELNLRNRLANWNQRVGASTASSSALVIQTVPANQQIHRHLDSSIGTGGSGEAFGTSGAPPGVYAFSVRLGLDPGSTGQPPIAPSLPIYYVFGLDVSATGWTAGRDHFRDLAIGTASMSLAVDDGVSSIDGITTNGRINVGSLNPRATKEFSIDGGSTWSPLANTGFFVVNAGTYAAGALQVRQTIVDHHGTRTTIGSNATAFTVVASDTAAPTVTITSSRSTLATGQTATIGFTMSEPVTGFTAADVVVTGGSLSGFTGSGTSYTATFTPLPNTVTTGTVTVAAGTFQDTAGNPNPAAALTPQITIDTAAPTVTITSSRSTLATGQTATIGFTMSEPVTGFTVADVVVTGGSLSGFAGSGTSYTATFTPLPDTVTTGTVTVAAGTFQDAAGNPNPAAALAPPIAIDTSTIGRPPGAPTGLNGTGNSDTRSVDLTWTMAPVDLGSPAANAYVVEYKQTADSAYVLFGTVATLNATVTGLTRGVSYDFRVTARNVVGTSGVSATTTVAVPTTVPDAPGLVSASVAGSGLASVAWTVPSDDGGSPITGYVVLRKIRGQADSSYVEIARVSATTFTASSSGLTNGIFYTFRVYAINANGGGGVATSNAVTIWPQAAAPTQLTGRAGHGVVSLVWTGPRMVAGQQVVDYQIQYRTWTNNIPGAWTTVMDGVSNLGRATVAMVNGGTYSFRVAAITAEGVVGLNSVESIKLTPFSRTTIPAVPTQLTGRAGNGVVSLVWTGPRMVAGQQVVDYQIQYRTWTNNIPGAWTTVMDGVSNLRRATVAMVNGGTYSFRVAAITAGGVVGLNSIESVKLIPFSHTAIPAAPTGVSASRTSATSARVSFTPPPANAGGPVSGYVIQYRLPTSRTWITARPVLQSDGSYSVLGMRLNQSYVFRIAARNLAGIGTYSGEYTLT